MSLADDNRAVADRMIDGEVARQDRLKAALKADAATAAWVEDAHLSHPRIANDAEHLREEMLFEQPFPAALHERC